MRGGNVVAWQHRIVGQSIVAGTAFESGMVKDGIDATSVEGATNLPYAIPNLRVDLHSPKLGVPVLWWRSVGSTHTAFSTETFLDELARGGGRIRSSCGAGCSASTRATSRCSSSRRRRPAGASRCAGQGRREARPRHRGARVVQHVTSRRWSR